MNKKLDAIIIILMILKVKANGLRGLWLKQSKYIAKSQQLEVEL